MSLEHASQAGGKGPSPWAQRQAGNVSLDALRVLRLPETERLTGYSNMQIMRLEKAGRFPKRFKLNPEGGKYGACGHNYGEVVEWLEERRASREQVGAKAK